MVGAEAIAITGIGAITPAGAGTKQLWAFLCRGESAASTVELFVERELAVTMAATVPDGDDGLGAPGLLSRKGARRADRFTQLASIAAAEALTQAGLVPSEVSGVVPE